MNAPRWQQFADLTGQGGQVQRLFPEMADLVVATAPLSSDEPTASARMTSEPDQDPRGAATRHGMFRPGLHDNDGVAPL